MKFTGNLRTDLYGACINLSRARQRKEKKSRHKYTEITEIEYWEKRKRNLKGRS